MNTPTNLNTKCVIFGATCALLYWQLACKTNVFMLPVIFTIAYVAMGWYDEVFHCSKPLYSGSRSWGMAVLDSIFKPQREIQSQGRKNLDLPEGKTLVDNQEQVYRRYMYLFHMLIVAPLLIYIGFKRGQGFSSMLLWPLFWLALLGMSYHMLRLVKPRKEQSRAVYAVHAFAILPLLLYVGYKQGAARKEAYLAMLVIGVVAELYHGFRYVTSAYH